jgi:2-polyprenyl-6-hydroxyphenyl methylase/3-demethylubiquinone-9 3-methyltransferase
MILDKCQVDAIDPLLETYRQMPHFSAEQYPHVQFEDRTLELVEDTAAYDWIFCMNAINHVRDIDFSMQLLTAALKPGGVLVITIDAHNYGMLKHLFRLVPGDVLHPHQYDLDEYHSLATKYGLQYKAHRLLKSESIFNHYLCIYTKPL